MIQDLLSNMESTDGPVVVAYFAHSTTVQLFITALGYGHLKTGLTATNFGEQADRIWTTSRICPLTSNVAVVRYDCADGIKIQFLLNERPLLLDFCDENGVCAWEDVKAKYATFAAATCKSYFCTS